MEDEPFKDPVKVEIRLEQGALNTAWDQADSVPAFFEALRHLAVAASDAAGMQLMEQVRAQLSIDGSL